VRAPIARSARAISTNEPRPSPASMMRTPPVLRHLLHAGRECQHLAFGRDAIALRPPFGARQPPPCRMLKEWSMATTTCRGPPPRSPPGGSGTAAQTPAPGAPAGPCAARHASSAAAGASRNSGCAARRTSARQTAAACCDASSAGAATPAAPAPPGRQPEPRRRQSHHILPCRTDRYTRRPSSRGREVSIRK